MQEAGGGLASCERSGCSLLLLHRRHQSSLAASLLSKDHFRGLKESRQPRTGLSDHSIPRNQFQCVETQAESRRKLPFMKQLKSEE